MWLASMQRRTNKSKGISQPHSPVAEAKVRELRGILEENTTPHLMLAFTLFGQWQTQNTLFITAAEVECISTQSVPWHACC